MMPDTKTSFRDPLLALPGYLLHRTSTQALAQLNARLAPLKLRHVDVALLLLLGANPGISQSEVGRRLDIQRANMVAFIARHERSGVIDRRPMDGRTQALRLTPSGRALLARARRIVAAHERALLARLPEKLRPTLLPVLKALWGAGQDARKAAG